MDGRSFEVFVEEDEPGEYRIVIGGEQYAVAVASERDARPARSALKAAAAFRRGAGESPHAGAGDRRDRHGRRHGLEPGRAWFNWRP